MRLVALLASLVTGTVPVPRVGNVLQTLIIPTFLKHAANLNCRCLILNAIALPKQSLLFTFQMPSYTSTSAKTVKFLHNIKIKISKCCYQARFGDQPILFLCKQFYDLQNLHTIRHCQEHRPNDRNVFFLRQVLFQLPHSICALRTSAAWRQALCRLIAT